MQRLATLAVLAALLSPAVASGQDYSFGDWARDQGYELGDVMPWHLLASAASPSIDSLDGIGDFDWTTTPTRELYLFDNLISSIEPGTFIGLRHLARLSLINNQISSIEPSDFSGLTNLQELNLRYNQISSIESSDFSGLGNLTELVLSDNLLSTIESGAFSGLTSLTAVYLHYNQISSIEQGDFTGLTNLQQLWLFDNQIASIEPGSFGGLANLTQLELDRNQISKIEPNTFSGLTSLTHLRLQHNQIASIGSGAFSGLSNLGELQLNDNADLTELSFEAATFSSLYSFDLTGSESITSVSLRDAELNQASLVVLMDGGHMLQDNLGIGDINATIVEMDLSGIDFVNITDPEPLYALDDLTDLWFVNTQNVDATALDELLDNLETIESPDTEGVLYMTQADYDAFNAAGGGLLSDWNDEEGHHVEFLQIGDVNHDTEVNGLDVDPFVDALLGSRFDVAADMNGEGAVNGLDVDPFVAAVVGGAAAVPEPTTLLLTLMALTVIGGWRKWMRVA